MRSNINEINLICIYPYFCQAIVKIIEPQELTFLHGGYIPVAQRYIPAISGDLQHNLSRFPNDQLRNSMSHGYFSDCNRYSPSSQSRIPGTMSRIPGIVRYLFNLLNRISATIIHVPACICRILMIISHVPMKFRNTNEVQRSVSLILKNIFSLARSFPVLNGNTSLEARGKLYANFN